MSSSRLSVIFLTALLVCLADISCNRRQVNLPEHRYSSVITFRRTDIPLIVRSISSITNLQDIESGVYSGLSRFYSCSGNELVTRPIVIVLVKGLRKGRNGEYRSRHDLIYVNIALTGSALSETIEHEIADHRMPYLFGDRLWRLYGHSIPAKCSL